MSTLTLLDVFERPSILGPEPGETRDADHGAVPAVGGAPTLDDLLTGTWEALTSGAAATCLICDGPLQPRYGAAGHAPVSGRCTRCGTELS
jgi:hypothetical protein